LRRIRRAICRARSGHFRAPQSAISCTQLAGELHQQVERLIAGVIRDDPFPGPRIASSKVVEQAMEAGLLGMLPILA